MYDYIIAFNKLFFSNFAVFGTSGDSGNIQDWVDRILDRFIKRLHHKLASYMSGRSTRRGQYESGWLNSFIIHPKLYNDINSEQTKFSSQILTVLLAVFTTHNERPYNEYSTVKLIA